MNEELLKRYLADVEDRIQAKFQDMEQRLTSALKDFERRTQGLEKSAQNDPMGILRLMPDRNPTVNEHGTKLGPKSAGYGDSPMMEAAIRKEPPRE